jgi:DNA-binding transcriptional ArsR family regulator
LAGVLLFDVLAERHRRQILDLLRLRERSVGELAAALPMSQPAVSKHLRLLRDAGLVDARVEAQRRVYRVRVEPLREVDEWLAPYRTLWSTSLDDLERQLDQMDDESPGGQHVR